MLNKVIKIGNCVEIEYYSFNQEKFTQRKIEPEIIERRNSKTYLNAFCHLRNDERVFRIDRIKKIKECG
ncbi:MAG: WYL domain-containing protein [Candidatus Helarchaeota archaeon]